MSGHSHSRRPLVQTDSSRADLTSPVIDEECRKGGTGHLTLLGEKTFITLLSQTGVRWSDEEGFLPYYIYT